jgi:capsular polysaccharide transport system permease protein
MTMKFSVDRFRIRRTRAAGEPTVREAAPANVPQAEHDLFAQNDDGFGDDRFETAQGATSRMGQPAPEPAMGTGPSTDIEAIRAEGLTTRQLRLARRVAQKYNLPATSDLDAIRLLRLAGIDPFQRSELLELVQSAPSAADTPNAADRIRLPQRTRQPQLPSTEQRADQSHLTELLQIQRDIARRRRRKSALLAARLFVFVLVPTFAAGLYFYKIATPLFSTKSEFVIQQADTAAGTGLSGLFRGTQLATSQDSIAVQGYLQSREAMLRLDKDYRFRAHFSAPNIDAIQRLDPNASQEAAYAVYNRNVKIGFDPTEGIVKLEVSATTPAAATEFATALISYAEEQVDQLTQRLREDQMKGARESYEEAEANMMAAQQHMVALQESLKVLSSKVEMELIAAQIGQLETQLTNERLSLDQMLQNENPNEARMEPVVKRITSLEGQIADLRAKLTENSAAGTSLAQVQSQLLVAEANVQTRQMMLAQSLQSMETARIEANRQVRYLSVSVKPIAPDEPSYPRAFENTMVALLLFAGIYLMIAMTAEILREQISA